MGTVGHLNVGAGPAGRRAPLTGRLSAAMRAIGANADSAGLERDLLEAWAQPHRVYHGTEHLVACVAELDSAPAALADPALVEVALWFHDAVYDPRSTDNEARSAEWARSALADSGAAPSVAGEVARLVLLTRHETPPADAAGALTCDIDLAILGRPEQEYDEFERRIRAEYAWVPESLYRTERGRVLGRFLARDRIYRTDSFHSRYETQARRNLDRALARFSTA